MLTPTVRHTIYTIQASIDRNIFTQGDSQAVRTVILFDAGPCVDNWKWRVHENSFFPNPNASSRLWGPLLTGGAVVIIFRMNSFCCQLKLLTFQARSAITTLYIPELGICIKTAHSEKSLKLFSRIYCIVISVSMSVCLFLAMRKYFAAHLKLAESSCMHTNVSMWKHCVRACEWMHRISHM